MHVSERGVNLVARFEGFRSKPYRDAVGVWTIGYGHTAGVSASSAAISRADAKRLLRRELDTVYAPAVRALGLRLTQNQFDALVSFVYNLGPGAIASSTTVGTLLRQGHYRKAANAMLAWNKAGGRSLLGLTIRRHVERRLFLRHL